MRHVVFGLITALPLLATSCSKEPEPPPSKTQELKDKLGKVLDQGAATVKQTAAFQQVVTKFGEVRAALDSVKDEASAKAAKVKLQDATDQLDQAKAALAQHGQMVESVKQKLGPTLEQAKDAVRKQVQTLQRDPQVNAAMGDVLLRVQGLLK